MKETWRCLPITPQVFSKRQSEPLSEIEARIIGDGPLNTSVRVTSSNGKRLALPATVTLASAAYARAAGWVVLVAFLALAVFVVVGVTRRIRKAHTARKPPASCSRARSPSSAPAAPARREAIMGRKEGEESQVGCLRA